jgi:hypothetical protein
MNRGAWTQKWENDTEEPEMVFGIENWDLELGATWVLGAQVRPLYAGVFGQGLGLAGEGNSADLEHVGTMADFEGLAGVLLGRQYWWSSAPSETRGFI